MASRSGCVWSMASLLLRHVVMGSLDTYMYVILVHSTCLYEILICRDRNFGIPRYTRRLWVDSQKDGQTGTKVLDSIPP